MDNDKIFRGTLEKRFQLARKELFASYNGKAALVFKSVYEDAPLTFILSHSRDIFSESYCGLDFYRNIMGSSILDTDVYRREEKKIKAFIGEATNKGMPKNQLDMYYQVHEEVLMLIEKYKELDEIFQAAYATENGREYIDCIVDALYYEGNLRKSGEQEGDSDVTHDADLMLDIIAKSVFTCKSIYIAFALGIRIVDKYNRYVSQLIQLTDDCMLKSNEITAEEYRRQRVGIGIVKKLMKSGYIKDFLKRCGNSRLSLLWYHIDKESIDNACPLPAVKFSKPNFSYVPAADGHNVADLEDFIEDFSDDPSTSVEKYDFCKYMATKLDADIELLGNYDNLDKSKMAIYENMEDLRNYYESEYLMLEWEDDGTPNPVLKKHIMTSKERAEEREKEEKEKNTPINNLSNSTDEKVKEADDENALCEDINDTIESLHKISPSDDEKVIQKNKEILAAARKDFADYKKVIDEHPGYKTAKALCDKLVDEIKDNDDVIDESVNEELEGRYDQFMMEEIKDDLRATSSYVPKRHAVTESDDSGDGEGGDTVVASKPKPDIPTRIQNKALDKAAKSSKRYAERKEKEQKITNAGKALAENPKRTGGEIKSFAKKWDSWDENRRKEFLLKPGFRHKIFRNFRVAMMYGVVAHVKLAWIPVLGLIRHCSRMKDARIRNEVSRELEAEIKICDEKISDANSKGDNESKYELMRIKEKLEAERSRVRTNSKYV